MIYIDADACPVRQEAIDIALRHQVRLVMVTNGGVRPYPHALIDMKYVSQGPDELINGLQIQLILVIW